MNQKYDLEDGLFDYVPLRASGRRVEEKSGLNPSLLGLRFWTLDVECWKFGSEKLASPAASFDQSEAPPR
jgi:hypothetical protein